MTITLGLQTGHESSAAIFEDGHLIAAVSDERLSRIKNDGGRLSDLAIDEVLRLADRVRGDVDALALLYTFFPEEYFLRESWAKELERKIHRARRRGKIGERPQMLLANFIERLRARGKSFDGHFLRDKFLRGERFDRAQAAFYDHHDSHALPAAFYSGFPRCAVFTMDGNGDANISHTSGRWGDGQYRRDYQTDSLGASPGVFYGAITELLGFRVMRHEGKVVGLAAMGDSAPLYSAFCKAFHLAADGKRFASDFSTEDARFQFLKKSIIGHRREDVAAAVQKVLEDAVLDLVRRYLAETGECCVALNGGVFANVKLNQRIAELAEVDKIFVFPAMSDTGNSIGAVLLDRVARDPTSLSQSSPLQHVYLGPAYGEEQIAAELAKAGVRSQRLDDAALIALSAAAIHEGRVLGWFQGRMEFGPRALGNRSMLARATDIKINDWLNERLDRSEFMPFAPSVLAEYADDIFLGVDKARHTAEFMTITFDVKIEWRARIPAVVHVDGTARPQLVRSENNPLYYALIDAYRCLSGIPLVLNTSFNVHEEPIVCAPAEAIRALSEGRVDCLAIGPFFCELDKT